MKTAIQIVFLLLGAAAVAAQEHTVVAPIPEGNVLEVSELGAGRGGSTTFIGIGTGGIFANLPQAPTVTFFEDAQHLVVPTQTWVAEDFGVAATAVVYESCGLLGGGRANCHVSVQYDVKGVEGRIVTSEPKTLAVVTFAPAPTSSAFQHRPQFVMAAAMVLGSAMFFLF